MGEVITWEEKTELVRLGNNATDTEAMEKFLVYVIAKMPQFDIQAWDMFITSIDLIEDEMKEHEGLILKIYSEVKKLGEEFGIRSAIRFGRFEQICEEWLNK